MKTHFISLSILSCASCVLLALSMVSMAFAGSPPHTVRASVSNFGTEGNGLSGTPSLSADGRLVAFYSEASNLVTRDHNGHTDVFVRNLKKGLTQRVSVDSSGGEADSDSAGPALSSNGDYVAFYSFASNLVTGDNNGTWDIFVRNLKTGVTKRVSVNSTGEEGNSYSFNPTLSANGRFVAFESFATNLVAGDNNGTWDVFVHDIKTGVTKRVSINSSGGEAVGESNGEGEEKSGSFGPSISDNGRYVAFHSFATNLVTGDNNGSEDVFVHDLKTGLTRRVSLNSMGVEGNRFSFDPSLSANGRFVAFASFSTNLVMGDNNGTYDVFVRDLKTGLTQCVSVNSAGEESNGVSTAPSFSANGRFVTFQSRASNLVTGDNNDFWDVFVRDLKADVTQGVSTDSAGPNGNIFFIDHAPLSANGCYVAFSSSASNFVENDNNGTYDVFMRRIFRGPNRNP